MSHVIRLGCVLGFGVLAIALPAEAAWVRGIGQLSSGASIDPLIQSAPDGTIIPTISTGQFNDGQKGFYSEADLGNGALRARVFINGGSGFSNANPRLGETLTFNNTTGSNSTWDFDFAIDGTVTSGANPIPIQQTFGMVGPFPTTFITFALHIFEGHTVGPTGSANDWLAALPQALFSVTKNIDGFPLTGDLVSFNQFLDDSITGSLPLLPGINEFDVVMVLGLATSIPGTTTSSIDMNFLNTAALSIDSPVAFTSDSGVFLTGNNLVPEPTSATLSMLAVLGATMLRPRRGRRAA